ncbi:hypothetical protein OAG36_00485, partial [bacterium]|nr:hypothetical protein [bacterium]
IESIKIKQDTDREGNVTGISYEIKVISKATVLPLAMKHKGMLTDKHQVEHTANVDWEQMFTEDKHTVDLIEQRIEDERNG